MQLSEIPDAMESFNAQVKAMRELFVALAGPEDTFGPIFDVIFEMGVLKGQVDMGLTVTDKLDHLLEEVMPPHAPTQSG